MLGIKLTLILMILQMLFFALYVNTELQRISLMIRGIQLTLSGDLSKDFTRNDNL